MLYKRFEVVDQFEIKSLTKQNGCSIVEAMKGAWNRIDKFFWGVT